MLFIVRAFPPSAQLCISSSKSTPGLRHFSACATLQARAKPAPWAQDGNHKAQSPFPYPLPNANTNPNASRRPALEQFIKEVANPAKKLKKVVKQNEMGVKSATSKQRPEEPKFFKVTSMRSPIGLPSKVGKTLVALRLKRRLQTAYHPINASVSGQILSVLPLVNVSLAPLSEIVEDARSGRGEGKGRRAQGDERGYRVIKGRGLRDKMREVGMVQAVATELKGNTSS